MKTKETSLQTTKENIQSRSPSLDMIRCFGLVCVVSEHFFLYTDFYDCTVAGKTMLIMCAMRSLFMSCIPLFLMLSGYLLNRKKICASYYKKLYRTIGLYLLSCGACILYRFLFQREDFSLYQSIRGIFNFQASDYGWYMKMYIGLFLLIPFLNILYHSLETQKHKKLLVFTMIALTAAPSIFNIWRFADKAWWLRPSTSSDYDALVPDWWTRLYPITYYYVGCYLSEFPLKLKRSVTLFLNILLFILAGLFLYYRSYGRTFVWGVWADHCSAIILAQGVLGFHLFMSAKHPKPNSRGAKFLSYLSGLTMSAYLCSCIFDTHFYKILVEAVPETHPRLLYFPIVVSVIYLCSVGLSATLNGIYDLLSLLGRKLRRSPKEA